MSGNPLVPQLFLGNQLRHHTEALFSIFESTQTAFNETDVQPLTSWDRQRLVDFATKNVPHFRRHQRIAGDYINRGYESRRAFTEANLVANRAVQ